MSFIITPSERITANPNHNLWNNQGTWFLHHTIYPTPETKQRVRRSLRTKDVVLARQRRDFCLKHPLLAVNLPPENMTAA